MWTIRGPRDFWAGVVFIAIGVATIFIGSNYSIGTAARMGPGYFPRALGAMLALLGALSVLRSLRVSGAALDSWRWRPLLIVLASTVIFGLIVSHLGLAISTVFLVIASSYASHEFRPLEAVVSGILMAILCVGVFVYALSIQLPVWPA